MSREQFDDNCPGCKPALISAETMQKLPDDSKEMQAILHVWNTDLTLDDKKAWHEFTCHNSREHQIMVVMQRIHDKFKNAIKKALSP